MWRTKFDVDMSQEIGDRGEQLVEDFFPWLTRQRDQHNGDADFVDSKGDKWEVKTSRLRPVSAAWYPLHRGQKSRLRAGSDWLIWVSLKEEKIYHMRYDGTIPQFCEFREMMR